MTKKLIKWSNKGGEPGIRPGALALDGLPKEQVEKIMELVQSMDDDKDYDEIPFDIKLKIAIRLNTYRAYNQKLISEFKELNNKMVFMRSEIDSHSFFIKDMKKLFKKYGVIE